jgi:S-adenosylmethionine:tRNA ribosyltransferase-isomerase
MSIEQMPEVSIQEYDYELPSSRIAIFPKEQRDQSKLLVYQDQHITHHVFSELPELLPSNSCLIFNNTKVIPARILIEKSTGAQVELFLLRPNLSENFTDLLQSNQQTMVWEVLVGNKKRWKEGDSLLKKVVVNDVEVTALFHWKNRGENLVEISWDQSVSMSILLDGLGKTPLPPYMEREANEEDLQRYQTVFSKEVGAVAAPTASLHFTAESFAALERKNISTHFLTLHVGAGTFLPVKVEQVSQHPMHREQVVISKLFIQFLFGFDGKYVPVGTTAMRALESLYWSGVYLIEHFGFREDCLIIPKEYAYQTRNLIDTKTALTAVLNYLEKHQQENWVFETEILIMPGFQFKFCDALVTNFHQPKSTLLVLISALVGTKWKEIYESAMQNDYRFLSYGDSSLLFNQNVQDFH